MPFGAQSGLVTVQNNGYVSNGRELKIAQPIAESLHPVANPAIDRDGNIYVTYSGGRGQKVPVAIYKIDPDYNVKPFLPELMNATGMAFDPQGQLYVSSRYDGTVYRVAPNGTLSTYAEGMGVATGIAFDKSGNLYVGDRSGTIWRIAPDRHIFVFATLEPSVAAYHLAFAPDGTLYVTGPTNSSFDAVYSVDPHGTVTVFYRGLGRPQGLAFDVQGDLYAAASLGGKRGIVKITPDKRASLAIAGTSAGWAGIHAGWRSSAGHHQCRFPSHLGRAGPFSSIQTANVNAEIIAIGSELLTPFRQDTNSLFLTEQLNRLGVEVSFKTIVGDRRADLVNVARIALSRADVVIFMGGLGPTEDDLTRECVAETLGRPLKRHARIVEDLRARFAARGWKMAENNERQGDVIDGADALYNNVFSAW